MVTRPGSLIVVLLFLFATYSCIDPYTPETFNYEEMLLIEGIIYDDASLSARVRITRNIPLDRSAEYRFESGAVVTVECDDGSLFPFSEIRPGVYENYGVPVIPEPGRSYRLRVETESQQVFLSDYEPYISGARVDSITYRPESHRLSVGGILEEGLRFYVNSSSTDDETMYLRWLLNATYNYSTPYSNEFIWTGSSVEMYSGTPYTNCWKNTDVQGIFIGNSAGMAENRVAEAGLNFVSQYGDQLMIKYSLEVVQLSISASAYKFWFDLKKLIDESGGLYETQPYRLSGNIRCVSDPDVQVSGVFEVAGVTRARTFAPRPVEFNIYSFNCNLDTIGTQTLPWESLPPNIFITEIDVGLYATASQVCYDCRLRGGSIYRPPFWE